jgi:hypothetical protein
VLRAGALLGSAFGAPDRHRRRTAREPVAGASDRTAVGTRGRAERPELCLWAWRAAGARQVDPADRWRRVRGDHGTERRGQDHAAALSCWACFRPRTAQVLVDGAPLTRLRPWAGGARASARCSRTIIC